MYDIPEFADPRREQARNVHLTTASPYLAHLCKLLCCTQLRNISVVVCTVPWFTCSQPPIAAKPC